MTVRRFLPHLLALMLGVGAAVLVACGGEGAEGGIPGANADDLKRELDDVRDFVDRGDCGSELDGQLRQVREQLESLPASVDGDLIQRLRDGVARLDGVAFEECSEGEEETTEETPNTVTEQVPTITETQPPAQTEPPPQEEQPAPEEEPAPVEPAPQDPANPGDGGGQGGSPGSGGTPPELVP